MPGSTASLESLSSPSPSPPPSKLRASPPAQSNIHDATGLDTGSELSELTEDEQESTESNSKTSLCKQPTRRTRRSLVPDQMWGWYKKKSDEKAQNYSEQEEEEELDNRDGAKVVKVMEEEEDEDEDGVRETNSNTHDQPPPQPAAPVDNLEQTSLDDSDSEVDEEYGSDKGKQKPDDNDAEESDSGTDDVRDDEEDGEDDPTDFEEDDQGEGEAQDSTAPSFDPTVATANGDRLEATMLVDADIIPLATTASAAASSIMAGSAVIKPPSPSSSVSSSRSPSPRPVSRRDTNKVEAGDTASIEMADVPVLAEEVDENPEDDVDHELESDLQPAHRAEALDVLATIELKFALLRERLYVEKMEALSWEESLLGASAYLLLFIYVIDLIMNRRHSPGVDSFGRRAVKEERQTSRISFTQACVRSGGC
jgi:hypothetical protein